MKNFSSLLQSNKAIFILLGLSVATVVLGILLIIYSSGRSENPANVEKQPTASLVSSLDAAGDVIAQTQKANSESASEVRVDGVRGDENWCEAMMLKSDADWNDEDAKLFSQKCL